MNLMPPMNQKFTRIFLTGMEVGDAYTSAVETILANPESRDVEAHADAGR